METQKRLQTNRDTLLEQYFENLEDVYNLQDTLIQSVLPSVTDELGLGLEAQEWAKEWLSDTPTIFRIYRRNRFTRSFCLEAVQRTLLWRFQNLWPLEPSRPIPNLYCLPVHIRDPLGRPILVLGSNPMNEAVSKQTVLIHALERLRLHLKQLYDDSKDNDPILQYVVLLDLSELSFQSIDINLFTWIAKELAPRFPGMIGAVFMLNYSWTHSGIWGVIKRLLPESALSRIFFPSNKDLIECLTPSALPQEFGGSLPSLFDLEDPLRPRQLTPSSSAIGRVPSKHLREFATAPYGGSVSRLSSTSALNPFYGYPVAAPTSGVPALRFGRRRKRDLIRTLAKLFWLRWHNQMNTVLCLVVLIVLFRFVSRKGLLRLPRGGPLSSLSFFDRPSAGSR